MLATDRTWRMTHTPTPVQPGASTGRVARLEAVATDGERRRVLRARAVIWAGIVGTGFLFIAAMLWYPGDDAGMRRGYSFGGDFLSAMGRTRAGSCDNTVSCLIFNGALILGGTILAVFWEARASFLTRPRAGTILRGCGLTMGLAMAGIGLTPCDFSPRVHDMLTHAVIVFGVICFGLCLVGSDRRFESAQSKLGWVTILVAAGATQALFLVLVSNGSISSRPALPVMQKLFVILLAIWAGWQGHLFGRACRTGPGAAIPRENARLQLPRP